MQPAVLERHGGVIAEEVVRAQTGLDVELKDAFEIGGVDVRARETDPAINEWYPAAAGRKVVPEARCPTGEIPADRIELPAAKQFVQPLPIAAIPLVLGNDIRENPAQIDRRQRQIMGRRAAERAEAEPRTE